uniref:Uncharacterized protein n=1 Tax=Magallana gigas TaxID=29159 RepID=A0A8W8P2A2_MAGGI
MCFKTDSVSWQYVVYLLTLLLFICIKVTEGFNQHNDIIDIGKSIQTIQVIETNHQGKEWNPYQKTHIGNWNAHSQGSKKSEHSGVHGRGVPNRFRRRRGMISQMSLGLGALSDKSMMYGPGLMTSGNAPGSNFSGSGGMSSMTSGPFANNGMSASMFPAGLSTNNRGIPSGLSNANSGMSPFSGSSSMKDGSNRSPFNMAMLSMQSQANLSPSMGGSTSLNSGSSVNSKTRDNWGKLERSFIFGDTASIQYIHGKIIVPKNWSIEKVNQLKANLENGETHKQQSNCPDRVTNCPKPCIVFGDNGCPVCSCKGEICPAFPAGCRKGRVSIDKDGCPVCDLKDLNHDWYNTIWENS